MNFFENTKFHHSENAPEWKKLLFLISYHYYYYDISSKNTHVVQHNMNNVCIQIKIAYVFYTH